MRALRPGAGGPELVRVPVPQPGPGEALVRVLRAGVCATDLELLRGYKPGFAHTLGHEFVGVVERGSPALQGQRVVGEINCPCLADDCATCAAGGDGRRNHCPRRTCVGIVGRDGVFAEFVALPEANLLPVPDGVSDAAAAFCEPLAAALRPVEQGLVRDGDRVAVLGDGRLGLLLVEALGRSLALGRLVLFGRHAAKCALVDAEAVCPPEVAPEHAGAFDVVVEATGSPGGLAAAAELVRPQGTVVLKTTCAGGGAPVDTTPLVVKEVRVQGSRCGPFADALALLERCGGDFVTKLLQHEVPLEDGVEGLRVAGERGVLKVQLVMS